MTVNLLMRKTRARSNQIRNYSRRSRRRLRARYLKWLRSNIWTQISRRLFFRLLLAQRIISKPLKMWLAWAWKSNSKGKSSKSWFTVASMNAIYSTNSMLYWLKNSVPRTLKASNTPWSTPYGITWKLWANTMWDKSLIWLNFLDF